MNALVKRVRLILVLAALFAGGLPARAASEASQRAVAAFAALSDATQETLVPLLEHAGLSVKSLRARGLKKALCEQVLSPIGLVSRGADQLDGVDPGLRQVIYNALLDRMPVGQAFFVATKEHPQLMNDSLVGGKRIRGLPRYVSRRALVPALDLVERQVTENLSALGKDLNEFPFTALVEGALEDNTHGGFRLRVHLRTDAEDPGISLYAANWREGAESSEKALAHFISAALLHRELLADPQEFLREVHYIRYQLLKVTRVAHREWRTAIRTLVQRLPVKKIEELQTPEQRGEAFTKYLQVKADLILLYQYRLHLLSHAARTEHEQGSRLPLPFHIRFVRDDDARRSIGAIQQLGSLLRGQGYYLPDQSLNQATRGFLRRASATLKPDALVFRPWFRGRINAFHLMLQSLSDLVFFAGSNHGPIDGDPPTMPVHEIFPLLGREGLVEYRENLEVVMMRPLDPLYFTGNDRPVLDVWALDDMRFDRSSPDVYFPPLPIQIPEGQAMLPDRSAFATELLDLRKVRSVAELAGAMLREAGLEADDPDSLVDDWDDSGLPDDLLAERHMRELRDAPPPSPAVRPDSGPDSSVINQIMGAPNSSVPNTPPADMDVYDGSGGSH